ncbi:hypothetical protein [Pseudogemmobacter sonorensis]|uniref:hypothetical protein n=1 Tax=Pseudogemmobacter sonorensis TaxID=2989681 RepID=UPI0036AD9AC2
MTAPATFPAKPCAFGPILRQIMQERGISARALSIQTQTPRANLHAFLKGSGRTPMHYVEAWFSHVGYVLDALPANPKQEARQCLSERHPSANAAR